MVGRRDTIARRRMRRILLLSRRSPCHGAASQAASATATCPRLNHPSSPRRPGHHPLPLRARGLAARADRSSRPTLASARSTSRAQIALPSPPGPSSPRDPRGPLTARGAPSLRYPVMPCPPPNRRLSYPSQLGGSLGCWRSAIHTTHHRMVIEPLHVSVSHSMRSIDHRFFRCLIREDI